MIASLDSSVTEYLAQADGRVRPNPGPVEAIQVIESAPSVTSTSVGTNARV
ncbi:hypothetical protein [Natronorubrum sp. FCH18a]|uniref:hypothetical protein n=1 Tax=Natronorubrum sp. FCH18a TaxID=3447018 RepID=UPI003F50EA79